MSVLAAGLLAVAASTFPAQAEDKGGKKVAPVLNFTVDSLAGKPVDLSRYQGKVVLVVNVASECGYTPQYQGLQKLHDKYAREGLAVLGFPSNDFGKQEPGSNAQIAEFCAKNYGVKFDMFAKVTVKGKEACPLYKFLTAKETNPRFAGPVKWNFQKYLISRGGEVVARFDSEVEPESEEVVKAITAELAKK
jgi:glutathione peroxidase